MATLTPALLSLLALLLPFGRAIPTDGKCNRPHYQHDQNVNGSYFVTFNEGHTLPLHFSTLDESFDVKDVGWGYGAKLSDRLLAKVRSDCGVQSVDDNVYGDRPYHGKSDIGEISEKANALVRRGIQQNANWALYQMSAAEKNPSDTSYYYLDDVGKGVDLYILDSGINHPLDEFTAADKSDRVVDLQNFSDELDFSDSVEDDGHGTLVASAAAGNEFGIAKSANIFNVKFYANGLPDGNNLITALNYIRTKHESRKTQPGFKGSVVNMSFRLGRTDPIVAALIGAYVAGISLVAAGGNAGYQRFHFPSTVGRVISVGGTAKDYTPYYFAKKDRSNYGEKVIDLWAPGKDVTVCNKAGDSVSATGTSLSAGFVSGTLAVFYGVEDTALTPELARSRLMAQTDDWVDLPQDGTNWHNSPTAFANTGNRKGAAKNPPVKYIDGPEIDIDPGPPWTGVCQSPDHNEPLTHFALDQGRTAAADFVSQCQGVELQRDGPTRGCILYFNPCSEKYKGKAVDVVMSVEQTSWTGTDTSAWPDVDEVTEAVGEIMNNCDTNTVTAKWGGYFSVNVTNGVRQYNVSANQDGKYPTPTGFHVPAPVTTLTLSTDPAVENPNCAAWDSS